MQRVPIHILEYKMFLDYSSILLINRSFYLSNVEDQSILFLYILKSLNNVNYNVL